MPQQQYYTVFGTVVQTKSNHPTNGEAVAMSVVYQGIEVVVSVPVKESCPDNFTILHFQ